MNAIKRQRRRAGLTQPALAAMLEVHETTVSKWENGIALPRAETLRRLAKIFSCTIDELLAPETDERE